MENTIDKIDLEIKKTKEYIRRLQRKKENLIDVINSAKDKLDARQNLKNSADSAERLSYREAELDYFSLNYYLESIKTAILFENDKLDRLLKSKESMSIPSESQPE